MSTNIVPISDLRREASKVVRTLRDGEDAVYITQHGRPAAVLLNYETYEAMVQELADLRIEKSEYKYPIGEPKGALLTLHDMAEDLGADDLAEQHDHYLYGVDKS